MGRDSREWLVPLTGILFAVLLIISFIVQGSVKDATHSPEEIAQWYLDHKDSAQVSAFIGVLGAAALIFFGAYLRKVLAAAEAEPSMLPILALIGVTIVAVGGAIDGMILFATAEAADDLPATSVQTIQAIWDNDFLPLVLGVVVFNWSVGISVLRTGALPQWMGWLAILGGVASIAGPIGFVGAIIAGIWVILASILLSLRARSAPVERPATA